MTFFIHSLLINHRLSFDREDQPRTKINVTKPTKKIKDNILLQIQKICPF
jgi:hypothetical protein